MPQNETFYEDTRQITGTGHYDLAGTYDQDDFEEYIEEDLEEKTMAKPDQKQL